MDQIKFSSILNESQQQFTDLFQGNKITSSVKKAGAAINSASKELKSSAKEHVSKAKDTATHLAKEKTKQTITEKTKQALTPTKKEKKKSSLDDLDTVSKGSTGKEKAKEAASKVGKTVKETASNPIKAGTVVGAVAGGAAGAAVGFGVGHMVKDLSDGAKEVKNKLLENNKFLFESETEFVKFLSILNESYNENYIDVVKKYKLPLLFKNNNLSWSKRGGHAGSNMISKTKQFLINQGWKYFDSKENWSGGGENVSYEGKLISPDKLYMFDSNMYYGAVASDNRFNMEIKKIK